MKKIIAKRNHLGTKTLEAYCSCTTVSCYCTSSRYSQSNYNSSAYNVYYRSTFA